MKKPIPVTLSDLEATAKDDKAGLCFYGYLKVYWDDATNNFNYWYKDRSCNKQMAEEVLGKSNAK